MLIRKLPPHSGGDHCSQPPLSWRTTKKADTHTIVPTPNGRALDQTERINCQPKYRQFPEQRDTDTKFRSLGGDIQDGGRMRRAVRDQVCGPQDANPAP